MNKKTHGAHVLHHFHLVNNLSISIYVLPPLRGYGYGLLAAVVTIEERERVTTGHNTCALIVE